MINSVIDKVEITRKYPYLATDVTTGTVVLFRTPGAGMVMHIEKDSPEQVGYYSTNWGEKRFINCDYSITLSNGG